MNRSRTFIILLASIVCLLNSLPATAHKLNIFSWAEHQEVYGEAFFSGGRKAKNISVQVQDAESHTILLTTETDDKGNFQFTPPQQAVQQKLDLLISAKTGDGHRGEWLLEADEYLLAAPSSLSSTSQKDRSASGKLDVEAVRKIVRQELEKELIPIKRKLAEGQKREIHLRDIIGGIGCIIGLAALLAWVQAGKKKKSTSTAG